MFKTIVKWLKQSVVDAVVAELADDFAADTGREIAPPQLTIAQLDALQDAMIMPHGDTPTVVAQGLIPDESATTSEANGKPRTRRTKKQMAAAKGGAK